VSGERRRTPRVLREAAWALGAALVSVAAAAAALRVTPAVLGQRWQAGGDDQLLHYLLFRSATQSFPYAVNDALGFPDGFNAFFTAQIDVSSALVLAVLGLVVHDGFLLLNVFHLLGFASVAVTAYAFIRCLRVPSGTAALVAALFSLAPYHFLRIGSGHAFLANYWAIPLLGILVLVVAGERTDPFRAWRARGATRGRRLLRGAVPVLLLPALIATTGGYYYVFSLLVLAGVWLLTAIAGLASAVPLRTVLGRGAPLAALGVLIAVELVLVGADWGERTAPYFEGRRIGESEDYAGKLLPLFLPWQGTEVPKIGALPNIYEQASVVARTTEPPGLPLVAIAGLCLLLLSLPLLGAVGGRALRVTSLGRFASDDHVRVLAIATLWTLLFYTVTGLGMAVSLIAGPTIRAWSRLSIVLALFALGAVAVGLARIGRRWVRGAVTALIVVVAVLDQLAGVSRMVPLAPTADEETASFVADVDAALEDGCGVVQLPVKSFPDSGAIGLMADYDEALPYLYTEGGALSWSYGSVLGTQGFAVFQDADDPAGFAEAVRGSGACAVVVDTAAYAFEEGAWSDDVAAVTGGGAPVAQSSSGRWLAFAVVR
jgi:hypothetical protein